MMYASFLTFVVAAYLVAAAPGDQSNVLWFEIEPAKEVHAKITGEAWELFKAKHSKQYTSTEEEAYRRSVFDENMKKIEAHNELYKKGEKTYFLGVNNFSDLKAEEFRTLRNGCFKMGANLGDGCSTFLSPHNVILPDTVDWRDKGYVTPVKNQLQCGSCWAFSTTGALEGQNFRKTGKLISFSEQQLVDCSSDFGNQGCNGGLMDNAFNYIKKYGIETEDVYPYKAKDKTCKFDASKVVANDTGCVDIASGSESALQQAVATVGPVSVAIDASHTTFQQYAGGVYSDPDCSSSELDHGVLAVGYGKDADSGQEYWLVKNSWGESWGVEGYIKMARNKKNMCGIATQSSYPLV